MYTICKGGSNSTSSGATSAVVLWSKGRSFKRYGSQLWFAVQRCMTCRPKAQPGHSPPTANADCQDKVWAASRGLLWVVIDLPADVSDRHWKPISAHWRWQKRTVARHTNTRPGGRYSACGPCGWHMCYMETTRHWVLLNIQNNLP